MRIFITGATGFAGSHLVENLVAAGHELFALVHQETSHQPLLQNERVTLIEGNLLEMSSLETAVAQAIQSTLKSLTNTSRPTNIIDNIIIGSIRQSAEAAATQAEVLGFRTRLLTARLEGEAREVGQFSAALAKDAPSQSATILGGETTVTLRGNGIGGRNLETALSAAISLAGWPNRTITSFATDGDDGPTGMAGATITGQTSQNNQTALGYLNNNDSFTYFQQLDSAGHGPHHIKTGPTGTNVNDLIIILNYARE